MKPSDMKKAKGKEKSKLSFDFEVPDYRNVPKVKPYTKGSGPKLMPIGLLLPDDMPNVIKQKIEEKGIPYYIVGDPLQPADRRRVGAARILDYVSRRHYENFEFTLREGEEPSIFETIESLPAKIIKKTRTGSSTRSTPSFDTEIKGSDISVNLPSVPFQQKIATRSSSIVSSSSGMFVTDKKSPDERITDSNLEASLSTQVAAKFPTLKRKRSHTLNTPFLRDSSDSSGWLEKAHDSPKTTSITQSSKSEAKKNVLENGKSPAAKPSLFAGVPNIPLSSNTESPSKIPFERASSALSFLSSTPALEAPGSREIQQEASAPKKKPRRRRSIKSLDKKRGGRKPPAKNEEEISEDEEDEDSQWEVDGLLDDEMRVDDNGQVIKFFLIDWKGDFRPTWEPQANIHKDVIETYYEKKNRAKVTEPIHHEQLELGSTMQLDDVNPALNQHGFKQAKAEHFKHHVGKLKEKSHRKSIIISDEEDDAIVKLDPEPKTSLGNDEAPHFPRGLISLLSEDEEDSEVLRPKIEKLASQVGTSPTPATTRETSENATSRPQEENETESEVDKVTVEEQVVRAKRRRADVATYNVKLLSKTSIHSPVTNSGIRKLTKKKLPDRRNTPRRIDLEFESPEPEPSVEEVAAVTAGEQGGRRKRPGVEKPIYNLKVLSGTSVHSPFTKNGVKKPGRDKLSKPPNILELRVQNAGNKASTPTVGFNHNTANGQLSEEVNVESRTSNSTAREIAVRAIFGREVPKSLTRPSLVSSTSVSSSSRSNRTKFEISPKSEVNHMVQEPSLPSEFSLHNEINMETVSESDFNQIAPKHSSNLLELPLPETDIKTTSELKLDQIAQKPSLIVPESPLSEKDVETASDSEAADQIQRETQQYLSNTSKPLQRYSPALVPGSSYNAGAKRISKGEIKFMARTLAAPKDSSVTTNNEASAKEGIASLVHDLLVPTSSPTMAPVKRASLKGRRKSKDELRAMARLLAPKKSASATAEDTPITASVEISYEMNSDSEL